MASKSILQREGVSIGLNSAPTSFPVGTKFRMVRDQMLVKVLPWKPSAIVDVQYHGRGLRGEIVAIGPGVNPWRYNKDRSKRWPSKAFRPCDAKVGDVVELGGLEMRGYPFQELLIGDDLHLICREEDIAIVTSDE